MKTSAPHHHFSRRLSGLVTVLSIAGLVLAGCGEDSPVSAPTTPTPEASASASVTPSVAATPSPKPTPTVKPPKPTEGSGDDEGDDEPAAAGGGICAALSEAEVGAVLGGEVTGSAIPGGGCSFNQRQPDPPAATVTDVAFADMVDGMEGAKTNATSSVEGDPQDVAGIGDAAFVVTGTSFGGDQLQGAGAVRVGDRLISVNLAQSKGLGRAKVRALVINLLKLAVARAGS